MVNLFLGDEKFTFDKWFFSGCVSGVFVHAMACSVQKVSIVKSKKFLNILKKNHGNY
jgi:hypothetical protein